MAADGMRGRGRAGRHADEGGERVNVDDEQDTCPRKGWNAFKTWVQDLGTLAKTADVEVSADVQFLSCLRASYPAYTRELRRLLASVPVVWVEMDTYFGELDYFQSQLRYYLDFVPLRRLGVGVFPTGFPNMTRAAVLARLCLFEHSEILHVPAQSALHLVQFVLL